MTSFSERHILHQLDTNQRLSSPQKSEAREIKRYIEIDTPKSQTLTTSHFKGQKDFFTDDKYQIISKLITLEKRKKMENKNCIPLAAGKDDKGLLSGECVGNGGHGVGAVVGNKAQAGGNGLVRVDQLHVRVKELDDIALAQQQGRGGGAGHQNTVDALAEGRHDLGEEDGLG